MTRRIRAGDNLPFEILKFLQLRCGESRATAGCTVIARPRIATTSACGPGGRNRPDRGPLRPCASDRARVVRDHADRTGHPGRCRMNRPSCRPCWRSRVADPDHRGTARLPGNFRFDHRPATFGTFFSSVESLRASTVRGVLYAGGGLEGYAGPIGLRFDIGDEIYWRGGARHNLRISFGPHIRF